MATLPTVDWTTNDLRVRADTARIQGLLLAASIDIGKLDGKRGPKSRAGLRIFQIRTNSGDGRGHADEIIGEKCWESLLTGKKH